MEWFGNSKMSFASSPDPLKLKSNDGSCTDLLRICEESTPSCKLNPLLFNGHLQTFYTAIKTEGPPLYFKRHVFEADGSDINFEGSFTVDFVVSRNTDVDDMLPNRTSYFSEKELDNLGSADTRPMLVALHGLSGGSFEVYLEQVLAPLTGLDGEGKWEACVINSRGCALSKLTSGVLYNARSTWDIHYTIEWLKKKFPNRPLFAIGFSLGANILTNYLGEVGAESPFRAAVVISNPWNLEVASLALQRSWIGREIYLKFFANNMMKLVKLHYKQMAADNPKLDWDRIWKIKYLHEFDREVQAPTWGYPTEGAYYRDASCVDSLMAIRTPLFAIQAADDPISVREALPYIEVERTPYVVMCVTSLGGHLSWFEPGGQCWHARPAVNFLNRMAFDVNTNVISRKEHKRHTSICDAVHYHAMRRRWRPDPGDQASLDEAKHEVSTCIANTR